jgi:carbon-monoxide dehydrogenase medium subunit
MMDEALGFLGHVAIRNRGTVVGSLAHADPAAEWPALALALDGEVDVVGTNGSRTISADSFFQTYFTTTMESDEVAVETRLRIPLGKVGSSFIELARRRGDFAIAGAGALLQITESGNIQDARIVIIGAGATALRAREAEQILVGEAPGDDVFMEAAEIAFRIVDPPGDIHGSAQFRRSLVRVLTRRALQASSRAAAIEENAGG